MFNLINILGQNTLPEQVEINKQNIAILADEVEKLGYQPKGVYDAETEYNHNDVVFYDNKLYVVTSDAAIVGVLPTNTTYWQQVTGDIRGPQGAQGEQGEAGAAGADGAQGPTGKAALVCTWTTTGGGEPSIGGNIQIALSYFNRTPEVDETFYVQYRAVDTLRYYFLRMQITLVSSSAYATILEVVPVTGADGQVGSKALVYDRNIPFTRTEDAEQLISITLPFANFNRTPILNEDFVGILEDAGVCYVAQCEVQSRSTTSVTSIVATDINRITGADGQNGTNGTDGRNGTDGKDALVYGIIVEKTYDISAGSAITGLSFTNFNREPAVNDKLSVVYKNTSNGKSFIATGYISEISSMGGNYFARMQIVSTVETTGASSQLYEHTINIIPNNSYSDYKLTTTLITNSPTQLTFTTWKQLLTQNVRYSISGYVIDVSNYNYAYSIQKDSYNQVAYFYNRADGTIGSNYLSSSVGFSDTVRTI